MASFEQSGAKICPKCKTETFLKKCPKCGAATKGSGLWSVRFRIIDIYGNEQNKRLSGFATKAEATAAYVKFAESYITPTVKKSTDMTLKELYIKYIEHITRRLKPSTVYDLNNCIKRFILPYFENEKVKNVDKMKIKAWQAELDSKYKYEYKSKLRTLFSAIFKYGMMYYDVAINPFTMVEPFRNSEPRKQMLFWTQTEFLQFVSRVDDLTYKAFFSLLYFSGCRKGEAFALTFQDINLNTGILDIRKSITRKTPNKPFEVTTPKNNSSYRKVLLPHSCLNLLSQLKEQLYCQGFNEDAFMFYGNRPLPENTVTRVFNKYCEIA